MKKLFYLISMALLLFAGDLSAQQTDFYKSEWEKVEHFDNLQMPQSAAEIVNSIYNRAREEKNTGQLIKAILRKAVNNTEENSDIKNLYYIENEIAKAEFPATSLLQSILAEMYLNYYNNYSYVVDQRSITSGMTNNDISTWDRQKFLQKVISLYTASVSESQKLAQVPIFRLNEILTSTYDCDKYARSLSDLLLFRAVEFYFYNKSNISEPVNSFNLNNVSYLVPLESFLNQKIETNDTISFGYKAITLCQKLLRQHLSDKDNSTLYYFDLKRVEMLNRIITDAKEDSLYSVYLEVTEQNVRNAEIKNVITYKKIELLKQQAALYSKQKPEYRWKLKQAYDLCQQRLQTLNPKSDSTNYLFYRSLISDITKPAVEITAEKMVVPLEPFKVLAKFKCTDSVYFKIISTDNKEYEACINGFNPNTESLDQVILKHYNKKQVVTRFSRETPYTSDLLQHSAELDLPALNEGLFFILASTSDSFDASKSLSYSIIHVSNIAYMAQSNNNGTTSIYLRNRKTGTALKGASATVWFLNWDYKANKNVPVNGGTLLSDENGLIIVKENPPHYGFYLDIAYKNEFLSTREYIYTYTESQFNVVSRSSESKTYTQTQYFTDRAIYRPGQTIYYKGIVYETDGNRKATIQKNFKIKVVLKDVNYQDVAEKEHITNEFGSFSGTFTAPANGLTGMMQIMDANGSCSFSVEEYKRPKFEVKFDENKSQYRLNDTLKITGTAKSYSGIGIGNARVAYRVTRLANFPGWFDSPWFRCPVSPESQIVFDTVTTDAFGHFEIKFKSIPDPDVSEASNPVFNYTINADVTDINGESHSANASISVGYSSLFLNAQVPEYTDLNDSINIKITARNTAGLPVNSKVNFTISRLASPARVLRERLWEMPDTFAISQSEFEKLFPNDVFSDETNFTNWKIAENMTSGTIECHTKNGYELKLEAFRRNLKPGKYAIELAAIDSFGIPVNQKIWFNVFDKKSNAMPFACTHIFKDLKSSGEPGEKAQFLVGSGYKSAMVLMEIEKDNKIISSTWLKLNNSIQLLEVPILEEYRGNVGVHFNLIIDNRFYSSDYTITVPHSDKNLVIHFETFRNKLEPGEKEQWRLHINGPSGDAALAEMVATLYDASLDAFMKHRFNFGLYGYYYPQMNWNSANCFTFGHFNQISEQSGNYLIPPDLGGNCSINLFQNMNSTVEMMAMDYAASSMDQGSGVHNKAKSSNIRIRGVGSLMKSASFKAPVVVDTVKEEINIENDETGYSTQHTVNQQIVSRINFAETAFFFPHLQTNEKGDILINFTIPEALTKWKMLGLAHTADLKYGFVENELLTQKTLMVTPNLPRFFRESDTLEISAKITCLLTKAVNGSAELHLFNALTMQPIDTQMLNLKNSKSFLVENSTSINWRIAIPKGLDAVIYKITASAGNFSDGEEGTLPVLTNRMLVTESMPMPVNKAGTKTFIFEKLAQSKSSTLVNHKLTLEFTNNPAWYAIQALPYLMEYPYECAEQTFSRLYANSIAAHIANSNPRIKQVFDSWKNITPDALLSNLEKNQELKSLILEETPWVLNSKNESEQKQRMALLFDLNHMSNELLTTVNKLCNMQLSNGGFPWFAGMRDDQYITQHILCGFGKLQHIGIELIKNVPKIENALSQALTYSDYRITDDYNALLRLSKEQKLKLSENHLSSMAIQYLYMRSFYSNRKVPVSASDAFAYFTAQCRQYWPSQGIYMQAMIALVFKRNGDKTNSELILKSLKERALHNHELGMYWNYKHGWYWNEAPIETQAMLIEAFDEVINDSVSVNEMKTWLLKQKQTQNWKTTKATVEACYALLLRGTDFLSNTELAEVKVGNSVVEPTQLPDMKLEAGTGYMKTSWNGADIKPEMATVTITKKNDGVSWGALYWQYFEQLDKITASETPLKLTKKLFVERNTGAGKVIEFITDSTQLKAGDLVTVRIELRADRDMEYIHLKDMRAAGFEPVNVLSGYKYQQGLSYYESTRDAATNFFINYLYKGTYVFEYPLRVNLTGNFSNGITSIQCMYAPEFTSHSEGSRVKVTEVGKY